MAVDSRISSKTYKTNVDELEPNDQNIKSDLYEVSIFNHPLKIAPGLVIQEDNLSYCYVYAIKNNKVVKKIGVYEKIEDDSEMFDLSTFSEGSLCLFDVYEKNPSLILELEDTETQTNSKSLKEDVFDFLLTKINDSEPEKQVEITKKSYKDILELLKSKKKEDSEDNKIITNLLNLIKKTIGDKKYYGEDTQDKIKKYATDFKKRMLALIVTEPFLGLRFIFTKDGEPIDDAEFRVWSIKSEIKEYVIVSENFEVIETYPVDGLDAKYKVDEPLEPVQTVQTVEPVPEESAVKTKTKAKSKSVKGTSLNGFEKVEPLSAIVEANESKPESKAESKVEAPEEVDLNAGIDYSEPPKSKSKSKALTKALSKAESKVETIPETVQSEEKKDGYDFDTNTVDEPVTKPKSRARTPKVDSKSKLKTPGPSIRPKSSQKK